MVLEENTVRQGGQNQQGAQAARVTTLSELLQQLGQETGRETGQSESFQFGWFVRGTVTSGGSNSERGYNSVRARCLMFNIVA